MKGRSVLYPIGWDDNGLPTERRVQNYYHVWCSPDENYIENLTIEPPSEKEKKKLRRTNVSMKNFIELCETLTHKDEEQFKLLFQKVGLSVDWSRLYRTMDKKSVKIAQLSFIDLYSKNQLYHSFTPSLWDIDFQTSIAQAEVEDKESETEFHDIDFSLQDDENFKITISTTRPELLPACVALCANPSDERYKHLFGKYTLSPLFSAPVPIIASELAEKEKGTGIMMVCTFGDSADVEIWKAHDLPLRQIIGKDGKIMNIQFKKEATKKDDFVSVNPDIANKLYSELVNKDYTKARKLILDMLKLKEFNSPLKNSKKINHVVKYFEKGSRPLEYIPSKQWYVKTIENKDLLLKQGDKIKWNPDFMKKKYIDWVQNLSTDWCISRQRFYGVPFPVWYRIKDNGEINYEDVILPSKQQLPVFPMFDVPNGFSEEQRGKPGGFIEEKDVFDTWFTSSLTPQIATDWSLYENENRKDVFPMSIRAQSHEIIRTWAFYTILKSYVHEESIPWENILISGWIVDNEGKKISKSKGNVKETPMDILNKYFSDGVRYWSGSSKLGYDTVYDENKLSVGRRLVLKIYNAGKLVFSYSPVYTDAVISNKFDLAFLYSLKKLVNECQENFDQFNFSKSLKDTEYFFFQYFTDNYLELVKHRARIGNSDSQSAIKTMRIAMNVLLRLFAPVLPFICEEVWSWALSKTTKYKFIHLSPFPSNSDFEGIDLSDPKYEDIMLSCLAFMTSFRKFKATNNLKKYEEIDKIVIIATPNNIRNIKEIWEDIYPSLKVKSYEMREVSECDEEYKIIIE